MSKPNEIFIIWDILAKEDLKSIFDFNKTNFSEIFASQTLDEIVQKVESVQFLKQFQEDDILGQPYRRIIVKNYKIIYTVKGNTIQILQIFDVRQNPSKMRKF
ncbi:MAG: type II toxin-antitoxin system RelE/ParE family toxin [Flavobacteriales bacterium]|nr:type II toxin-antitoxin system RelE/ParE family toxin [Flavobacteriales bacterium]